MHFTNSFATKLLYSIAFGIGVASAATQATFYVAPNGSDAAKGTKNAPFKTITFFDSSVVGNETPSNTQKQNATPNDTTAVKLENFLGTVPCK